LAISIKQQVAPLQANEVANIRRKLSDFDFRQQEFREDFHKMAAFSYSCVYPYDELDRVGSLAAYIFTSVELLWQSYHVLVYGGPKRCTFSIYHICDRLR